MAGSGSGAASPAGVAVGVWYLRRHLAWPDVYRFINAVTPALLVAQSIGRIGNYFNQELFGKPSTLPWALKISPAHRPPGYAQFATFQPTFLYEIIWNLLLAAALVWLDNRRKVRPPGLFALYVAGYSAFRIFEETLRIDYSQHILGMRLNFWVALIGTRRRPGLVRADPVHAKPQRHDSAEPPARSTACSIRDLGRREPGAPRGGDAVAHHLEAAGAVRVAVDHERDPGRRRVARVQLVEVAAVGVGVDLEHRARAHRGFEHRVEVELVGRPLQDLAPAQVADAVDVGVLDRAHDAGRHLGLGHPERGVDAGHDPVELGQQLVGVVERAVRAGC